MKKVFAFVKEAFAELKKVVWPSRKETIRYTAMVIAFSVVTAVILGAADYGLLRGVQKILGQ
jgi:preprotein translocase subunit SecE